MLTYTQINDYFERQDFQGAAGAIATEGARLGQMSASHPVMNLLRCVRRAQFAVEMSALDDGQQNRSKEEMDAILDDAKRSGVVLQEAAAVLRVMLSLPSKQRLKEDFNLSPDQVNSLSYAEGRDSRFGDNQVAVSMLENIAALGWREGLEVMREFFPDKPDIPRLHLLVAALDSAASNNQPAATEDILKWPAARYINSEFSKDTPILTKLVTNLFCMKDVSGNFISRAMAFFPAETIGTALSNGYINQNVPKNTLAWFSESPDDWAALHNKLKNIYLDKARAERDSPFGRDSYQKVAQGGAWPALLSAVLSSPSKASYQVLEVALKCEAAWWLQKPAVLDYRNTHLNLASAIVQGIIYPGPTSAQEREPSVFSKLRARVSLIRRLVDAGARLRVAEKQPTQEKREDATSELGNWARDGYAPTKAFLSRRPSWKTPFLPLARGALFEASSPEVFEKLVDAGLDPSILDGEGRAAAVFQLQRMRDGRAGPRELQSWAKICALELGKNIIAANAMGVSEDLGKLAPTSVTLMRTWLKCTGKTPSQGQLEQSILAQHYLLVRDWVKAGLFDNDKPLQKVLWRGLFNSIKNGVGSFSEAQARQIAELLNAVATRPAWDFETREQWKFFWTGRTVETSDPAGFRFEYTMRYSNAPATSVFNEISKKLADRAFDGSEFSAFERALLLHVASSSPNSLIQAIPSKAGLELKTQLFWDLLTPSKVGNSNGARNRFWAARELFSGNEVDPDFGFNSLSAEQISSRVKNVKKITEGLYLDRETGPAFFIALDEAALRAIVPTASAGIRRRI
jgi:hypothetical protein